jgi:hypothetical protein
MLRTIDSAASLGAAPDERFSRGAWPPLTILRAMCEALHEGLAIHREYEAVRSNGIPHDAALRRALGIGPAPSWQARGTIAPLCFAGRA